MRARRIATIAGTGAAALVLLGAPAWAEPTPGPDPTPVVDESPLPDPANDSECMPYEPGPDESPTDDGTVTAEPAPSEDTSGSGTAEPDPTTEPDPTADPEATADPDPGADPQPTGGPVYVCYLESAAGGLPEGAVEKDTAGLGSVQAPQLPRTGGPAGPLAVTGLALVVGGSAVVLVARRRTT